ncbi:MAG: YicC family protein [Spirochaetia bacterium]|nr:YicC family protein [Spirochaetia bacterium]
MFTSMTGFARREFKTDIIAGAMQIKSYNNRYLDIVISLPPQLSMFEPLFQQALSESIRRGKIEFSLRVKSFSYPVNVQPDTSAAKAIYSALAEIGKSLEMTEKPNLSMIASFDGVLQYDRDVDIDVIWQSLKPVLNALIDEFNEHRKREGQATGTNIFAELDRFTSMLAVIRQNASQMDELIKTQLRERFDELLPKGYDEQRLLQEVAVQLVRLTINEEIARLDAHLAAFKTIAAEQMPAKKLDFLCQEMNREVNTIGSKNILIPVSHAIIEMKDALENIREQLRNIE